MTRRRAEGEQKLPKGDGRHALERVKLTQSPVSRRLPPPPLLPPPLPRTAEVTDNDTAYQSSSTFPPTLRTSSSALLIKTVGLRANSSPASGGFNSHSPLVPDLSTRTDAPRLGARRCQPPLVKSGVTGGASDLWWCCSGPDIGWVE